VNKSTWMQAIRLPVRLALPTCFLVGIRLSDHTSAVILAVSRISLLLTARPCLCSTVCSQSLQAWCADSYGSAMQLPSGDGELDDATVTLKPGQLAGVMSNPELLHQLTGHRGSRAPEAGHIHLTPDTDPENTFRTRQANKRPRVRFEELFAPDDSTHLGDEGKTSAADADQEQGQSQV